MQLIHSEVYKMEDLSHFCCQNMECPDYGKRGTVRLTVCITGKTESEGYTKSLSKHENVKCCFFVFFVVKKRGIPRTLKAIWYYYTAGPDGHVFPNGKGQHCSDRICRKISPDLFRSIFRNAAESARQPV